MKRTFTLVIITACTALFGACDAPKPTCSGGGTHKWTRWTDEWEKKNDFGYMLQRRYCETCGVIEIQPHN